MSFQFPKSEKLCHKRLIDSLFDRNSSASKSKYPLRVVWKEVESSSLETPVQVTFSAPKRNFKKAVDRNRIKRLMREAYRLNNKDLKQALDSSGKQIIMMVLFMGNTLPTFKEIEEKTINLLSTVKDEFDI